METRLLSGDVVEAHAEMARIVEAVEAAFGAYASGHALMPPKSYVDLPQYNGDFRSMPAYVDGGDWDAAGIKWVNVHTDNPGTHGLPTVMGTMFYSDPETAFPLAILDATALTGFRTGAAAAVATDHLASPDATSLGIVGAGAQASMQLEAIATVRDIERVVIADRNQAKQEAFAQAHGDAFEVVAGSIEAASSCEIVSTVTPVEEPIVEAGWIEAGTHINAMGADAPGKHELADDILRAGRIFVDDIEQATHSGEINVPLSKGTLDRSAILGTLGEIINGDLEGRQNKDDVTIFDSTGLAIQDIAAAHVVYEGAVAANDGTAFELLDVGNR